MVAEESKLQALLSMQPTHVELSPPHTPHWSNAVVPLQTPRQSVSAQGGKVVAATFVESVGVGIVDSTCAVLADVACVVAIGEVDEFVASAEAFVAFVDNVVR